MTMTTQTTPKKLPLGIQTFATLRNENFYYVDKTQYILQLLQYHYIFLSRPRRFGKSLTLDTIAELFMGHKELFTGLYAENHWDWDTTHPVIRLGFAEGIMWDRATFDVNIQKQLQKNAKRLGLTLTNPLTNPQKNTTGSNANDFEELITQAFEKYQQKVVILIDEYDKPILDNLQKPDIAFIMRDALRDLYSVIKGQDAQIRFAMLTGVSKFSKVNLFSGLNNLNDVTLDSKFSALCGYTQNEIDIVFAEHMQHFERQKVKDWYNGYNWTGEAVYNPFDILFLFDKGQYRPYWFETGTPTFLIDKLVSEGIASYDIHQSLADDGLLSSFDVGDISPMALMFQTGYLTIKDIHYQLVMPNYILGFPNLEVQYSLTSALLSHYYPQPETPKLLSSRLYQLLLVNGFDAIHELINAFFASIPHDWHRKNNMAHCSFIKSEGYWASVFYAYFASLGLQVVVEDSTSHGRMDMTVDFNDCIYIFEFKVIEQSKKPNSAIEQIKEKGYANKYLAEDKAIYLIGVEFSEVNREVANFMVEKV